ncbi:MAG: hypothetical protein ACK6AT_19705, partial [Planctomycetota bacterium]
MESKKIILDNPGSTPTTTGRKNRSSLSLLTLLSCFVFLCSTGCPSQSSQKKQIGDTGKKVGRVDLPPLKIGIVDCDELTESIQTRWQEFSEQQIELIKVERGKINNTEIPSLDVILYPAHFLGTIAETDWIAPVPTPLLQRLGVGSKAGKSNQEVSENPETGIENWSSRWRSIAISKGHLIGLRVGGRWWGAATRGLDGQPVSYTHLTLPTTRQKWRSRGSPYH